jgi:hypothetical protein
MMFSSQQQSGPVTAGPTRRLLESVSGQKILTNQTAKAPHGAAARIAQRFRGQSCGLVFTVRFTKKGTTNAAPTQIIGGREQTLFGRNAA